MQRIIFTCLASMLAIGLIACGGNDAPNNAEGDTNSDGDASATSSDDQERVGLELAELPVVNAETNQVTPGSLIDAEPEEGKTYILEGRVQDISKGYHQIKLVDEINVGYCHPSEGCLTPWDYCCAPKDELQANTVVVKFQKPDERMPRKANGMRPYRYLDLIKVAGSFKKSSQGNWVFFADGFQRVERVDMPDDVKWPEDVEVNQE